MVALVVAPSLGGSMYQASLGPQVIYFTIAFFTQLEILSNMAQLPSLVAQD